MHVQEQDDEAGDRDLRRQEETRSKAEDPGPRVTHRLRDRRFSSMTELKLRARLKAFRDRRVLERDFRAFRSRYREVIGPKP